MLNKNNERELAYVVKVGKIHEIDGYDRVEFAEVNGWGCIVPKGAFKEGDPGIYFEIDSLCPQVEPFLFLANRKFKVKTQKMCKHISQGLLMAAADFGWTIGESSVEGEVAIIDSDGVCHNTADESKFLTQKLGVTYYDPEDVKRKSIPPVDEYKRMQDRYPEIFRKPLVKKMMKFKLGRKILLKLYGKKKSGWPAWVSKTDEERVQNMPYILEDKQPWIATEKIDGSSTTFTMKKGKFGANKFYICSRNVVFDTPQKEDLCYYDSNIYTEMAKKYDVKNVLKSLLKELKCDWVTIQGETFGAGVQKRDYGMKGHDFRAFNLITSNAGRFNSVEAEKILAKYGIKWVPIVDENFILPDTIEELLDYATGTSEIDGGMREGIVFRTHDGVKSFKAVSNEFLLKYHG